MPQEEQMSVTFEDTGPVITTDPVGPNVPAKDRPDRAAETPPRKAPEPEQPEEPEPGEPSDVDASTIDANTTEAKARESGWKPLAEYGGDPRKWVEARVWVENKPLVDQVRATKQQIREKDKRIAALTQHYKTVHDTAYRQAIADLQQKKDAAVLEQDVDKVRQIDQQIDQTRVEQIKTAPVVDNTPDPAYGIWLAGETGKKVHGDPELWDEAVVYETGLMQQHPEMDVDTRLEKVEAHVRRAFPQKFTNPRRTAPAMVEAGGVSGTAPSNGQKRFSVSDLTPTEKQVMATLVRTGDITQEQYLKDIKESREGRIHILGDK